MKPNTTEFSFFYYNGQHLRKHSRKIFSQPDETIQRRKRKMKVEHQKDDKNMATIFR